jgi:hypothetical protein
VCALATTQQTSSSSAAAAPSRIHPALCGLEHWCTCSLQLLITQAFKLESLGMPYFRSGSKCCWKAVEAADVAVWLLLRLLHLRFCANLVVQFVTISIYTDQALGGWMHGSQDGPSHRTGANSAHVVIFTQTLLPQ